MAARRDLCHCTHFLVNRIPQPSVLANKVEFAMEAWTTLVGFTGYLPPAWEESRFRGSAYRSYLDIYRPLFVDHDASGKTSGARRR